MLSYRQLIHLFLVVVVVTATLTIAQELIDSDTINIEAGEIKDELTLQHLGNRRKRATLTGPDGTIVTINCQTARNEEGHCKPFKECYPLFRSAGDDGRNSEKQTAPILELESIYRNISGPCDESILNAIGEISVGKVFTREEYACCPVERKPKPSKPPTTSRPPANVSTAEADVLANRCGKVHVDYKTDFNITDYKNIDQEILRIVNGRVAARGEYPWVVALMNRGRQFCGGSLITKNHILTAAHCIFFMNANDVSRMRIHLGDHNVYTTNDGPHEVRSVSNVYYHRGFSMNTLYNDVSVIRLSQPVQFTKYIQPVCLHSGNPRYDGGNTYADVQGWGQIVDKGSQSSVLRTVSVKVLTQAQCKSSYGNKAPAGIIPSMVCAGGNGRDSCKGDSGGPLTIHQNSQASQIGIVSFGIGCATYPGVYTRVPYFLDWINKNRR